MHILWIINESESIVVPNLFTEIFTLPIPYGFKLDILVNGNRSYHIALEDGDVDMECAYYGLDEVLVNNSQIDILLVSGLSKLDPTFSITPKIEAICFDYRILKNIRHYKNLANYVMASSQKLPYHCFRLKDVIKSLDLEPLKTVKNLALATIHGCDQQHPADLHLFRISDEQPLFSYNSYSPDLLKRQYGTVLSVKSQ